MATYSIREAGNWLKAADEESNAAMLRGLNAAALRLVQHIQTVVIPGITPEPVARGAYKAAWRAERLPNGAEVVNTTIQSIFIEYGVKPGNVHISRKMIEALAAWVRMKGIGGRFKVSKTGVVRLHRASKDEAIDIAWAIAKSMQKHGIFRAGMGLKVLETAGKSAPMFIRQEVERELKKTFGDG
jgi:hypothetical protein